MNQNRFNPLVTDLYQLTMSQGFFDQGIAKRESCYYLHWRKPAFENCAYSTVAGVEEAMTFLRHFYFTDDDILYLSLQKRKEQNLFSKEFLLFLRDNPLQLDVAVLQEGEIQTTPGPVMMIKGALYQCLIVESALLNIINRNSMIATRASMLHEAAEGSHIADFGLRRAASLDISGVRAAYIGGCFATSDVDAGRKLGIPVTGTMGHAWVMNFQESLKPNTDTELDSFKAFLKVMSHNAVLIVDTYNPYQGIDNAIRASIEENIPLDGVRIDSGDLASIAWYALKQIKQAQKKHNALFGNTRIFVTDELDEHKILNFRKQLDILSQQEDIRPCPNVFTYGVGVKLQNPGPFKGGVYKASAREGESGIEVLMKLACENVQQMSSLKMSLPGADLDILRLWQGSSIVADIIVDKTYSIDSLLSNGVVINTKGEEVLLPRYDRVEMLLKPAFQRNANGMSEYVFAEPDKVTLYNGIQVSDLAKIRTFHLERKAGIPEFARAVEGRGELMTFIDPQIQKNRLAIINKTKQELENKRF